jgi:hypothetical protein
MTPTLIDTKSLYGDKVLIEKNDYHMFFVITKIGSKLKRFGQEDLT